MRTSTTLVSCIVTGSDAGSVQALEELHGADATCLAPLRGLNAKHRLCPVAMTRNTRSHVTSRSLLPPTWRALLQCLSPMHFSDGVATRAVMATAAFISSQCVSRVRASSWTIHSCLRMAPHAPHHCRCTTSLPLPHMEIPTPVRLSGVQTSLISIGTTSSCVSTRTVIDKLLLVVPLAVLMPTRHVPI